MSDNPWTPPPSAPSPPPPPAAPPPPAPPVSADQYGQAPVQRAATTDGFSIASLILGVLGFSLFGLVFGFVGLSRTKHGRPGRGLAIGGIIASAAWLVVTIAVVVLTFVLATRDAQQAGTSNGHSRVQADENPVVPNEPAAPTTPQPEIPSTMSPYDCLSDRAPIIHAEDVVPCSEPHIAQIISTTDAIGSTCPEQLPGVSGLEYRVTVGRDGSTHWCMAVPPNHVLWTGSFQDGSAAPS